MTSAVEALAYKTAAATTPAGNAVKTPRPPRPAKPMSLDAKANLVAGGLNFAGSVGSPILSHVLPARSEDVTKHPKNPGQGSGSV